MTTNDIKRLDETNGLNKMSNTAIFRSINGNPVVVCGKMVYYLRENVVLYILKGWNETEQINRLFHAICNTTQTKSIF